MKRRKPVGTVLGIIAAVLAVVCVWYISDYYHASDEVGRFISGQGDVHVDSIREGLFLDGPGSENALIFYPGGKVEYTAYLPMLYDLAEGGTDVFLLKMPANLAFFGIKKADDIIADHSYRHWYLGGHSLGGVAASFYVNDTEYDVDGLVLLASYTTKPLPDTQVLELYGSEDLVLNHEKLQEGKSLLPDGSVIMEIPGGNHAQFGNYGVQKGDGEAAISRKAQQEVTVQMIEKMIAQDSEQPVSGGLSAGS